MILIILLLSIEPALAQECLRSFGRGELTKANRFCNSRKPKEKYEVLEEQLQEISLFTSEPLEITPNKFVKIHSSCKSLFGPNRISQIAKKSFDVGLKCLKNSVDTEKSRSIYKSLETLLGSKELYIRCDEKDPFERNPGGWAFAEGKTISLNPYLEFKPRIEGHIYKKSVTHYISDEHMSGTIFHEAFHLIQDKFLHKPIINLVEQGEDIAYNCQKC